MKSEREKEGIVIARPGVIPWMGAGFCWVMALLMPVLAQSGADHNGKAIDWATTTLALVIWLLLGLLSALHAGLSKIIAGPDGLRWYIFSPLKPSETGRTADWEDITDFYDRSGYSGAECVVEMHGGIRLAFSHYWRELVPLREIIAERATHAEAAQDQNGKRTWMPKGARPAELPATFAYGERRLKKLWRGILASGIGLLTIVLGGIGLLLLFAPSRSTPRQEDLVTLWLILGLLCVGMTSNVGWSLYQEGRNFRLAHQRRKGGEVFVAERDGLTIWRDGEARKLRWEEIVGYEFPQVSSRKQGNLYSGIARLRIRTVEEYSFTPLIDNYILLSTILRQFATEAVEFRRDQNEAEALGGIAARWSGGEEGKGERVFHRRTRTLRAGVIAVYLIFALTVWGVVGLFLIPYGTVVLPVLGPIALLTGILAWYETVEYLRDRVLVSKEGVTHINKHGRERHLRWEEIDRVWTEGNVVALTARDGSRIQLVTTSYAYGNELPTLLTERLEEYRRSLAR